MNRILMLLAATGLLAILNPALAEDGAAKTRRAVAFQANHFGAVVERHVGQCCDPLDQVVRHRRFEAAAADDQVKLLHPGGQEDDRNRDQAALPKNLRGRIELRTGVEAHQLSGKVKAIKDCASCHRQGAELPPPTRAISSPSHSLASMGDAQ